MITDVQFIAHWTVRLYEAEKDASGQYCYNIQERFIPVSEISKPYNINAEWGNDAAKALLGSNAVDLVSSFAGYNVAMDAFLIDGKRLYYRFLTKDVQVTEGDVLCVLVPPPGR